MSTTNKNKFSVLNTDEYQSDDDNVVDTQSNNNNNNNNNKKDKKDKKSNSSTLPNKKNKKQVDSPSSSSSSSPSSVVTKRNESNKQVEKKEGGEVVVAKSSSEKSNNIEKLKLKEIEDESLKSSISPTIFNQIVSIFIVILLAVIVYASHKFLGTLISTIGTIILSILALYLLKELIFPVTSDLKKFKTLHIIKQLRELRDEKKRLKEKNSNDKNLIYIKKRIEELELEFEKLDNDDSIVSSSSSSKILTPLQQQQQQQSSNNNKKKTK